MSGNTPLMKVNDSDKQRPSDGKILPDAQGHMGTDGEGGCGDKMKQNKGKVIGVLVVLIVAIILAVTLSGGGSTPGPKPGPTPPQPPVPPEPINSGFNPYYIGNETITLSKNKVSGVLLWN